jgi:hypothetical protein
MEKLNPREKILFLLIALLIFISAYFAYNLYSLGFFNYQTRVPDFKPPTIEETIKSSNIIFTCTRVDEDEYIKFKIDRILYKKDNFQFPYKTGEIYSDLSYKKLPNTRYGDGRLVFICDGQTSMSAFSINNNEIEVPDDGNSAKIKIMTIEQISELIKLYKNS